MNPDLAKLQPYPFEKLAQLKNGITPPAARTALNLSIGEPQHGTPGFITEELITHLHRLSRYPVTKGDMALRAAIAQWLSNRFQLPPATLDPDRHILPVNGTREALFAFAQCVVDRSRHPLIAMPNPFYQIYEGAALLAGAEPYFLNTLEADNFLPNFDAVPEEAWRRCQLIYVCSPANPTGSVMSAASFRRLIELADKYDFVIASDECYSEIYLDETRPPVGLLQIAAQMGNTDYRRCIIFHSLSKRSNVPGMRSGFVAGDAKILEKFLLYRTYHGCAMPPPVQAASTRAWQDEQHVRENRRMYREKFDAVLNILGPVMRVEKPAASFYLWPQTPMEDAEFARRLYAEQNVTVLPGSYLSRVAHGVNPGHNRVRIALVPPLNDCIEAAGRISELVKKYV